MNATQLFYVLSDNFKKLEDLPNELIQIEEKEFYFGDEFDNQCGYEFVVYFNDKSAYRVSKTFFNNIDEHGYNDSYYSHDVREYYNDCNCNADDIYKKLKPFLV